MAHSITGSISCGRDALLAPARIASGLMESLPLGLVVFDPDFLVVRRNRLVDRHLPIRDLVTDALGEVEEPGGCRDWPDELRRVLETHRAARFEGIRCREGTSEAGVLNIMVSPLFEDESQRPLGGLLLTEDVTARVGMEQRLAVAERLAALGKLASRVAHELNNPLDGVLRYIHLALRVVGTDDRERAEHYLTQCRRGLQRMVQIVGDLLEFSRSAPGCNAGGNINAAMEDALGSFEERIDKQGVTVRRSLCENVPGVPDGSLYQVFSNMIKNALDVMPDGGELRVETRIAGADVEIAIGDTGPGLPAASAGRIFEPFFSTKTCGKGTGLGLAICREIVERMNGRIEAANGTGGGAVFRIRIPLARCVRAHGASLGAENVAAGGVNDVGGSGANSDRG